MRRIIVREARPGMHLARQVTNPRDAAQVAIATGTTLGVKEVVLLHELGVYDLWVDDPDLSYLEALHRACSGDPSQQRLIEALMRTFQSLAALGVDVATHAVLKRQRLFLESTMSDLVQNAPKLPCFRGIADSEELLQHSADVAVLSTLLGLQLENYLVDQRRRLNCRQARDVLNLAMGAFFHDVGETLLPANQRESRNSLSTDCTSGDDWKQHTHLGYTAVRGHLDPPGAAVVLHHHQHFDGSGFAIVDGRELRQSGNLIHVFARIATVADMFHHLLRAPDAGVPAPVVQALWQLQQGNVHGWLDPVVLRALVALIPPFAPGTVVMLNDRRLAVVTRVNSAFPCYPEVQVLHDLEEENAAPGEQIDLAARQEPRIVEVGGEEVMRYCYGKRQAQPLVAA